MLNARQHFGLSAHAEQLSFKMRLSNSFVFAIFLLLLRENRGFLADMLISIHNKGIY